MSTYDTDWAAKAAKNADLYGSVFLDADINGALKSIYVIMKNVDSRMADINANFTDANGDADTSKCTAVSATLEATMPFIATATNAPFNTISDSGKYNCRIPTTNGLILFGRSAIAAPDASCTDAFEYYVMDGYSFENGANTESVATRGSTRSQSMVTRTYYNGCSAEMSIQLALFGKYELGEEFNMRTELTGIRTTHAFSFRAAWNATDGSTYHHFNSLIGTGVSKKAGDSDATVNFITGHSAQSCDVTTRACDTVSNSGNYCVKNSGTSNNYELDTTSANCSALEATYSALVPFADTDIPSVYYSANAATDYGIQ